MAARRSVCGQDPEGSQARRSASGAANEIRSSDQLEDGKTDRSDDSSKRVGEGGQGDQMKVLSRHVSIMSGIIFVLLIVLSASAQPQPKKLYRIGYLRQGTPTSASFENEAFRQVLRDFGYVEGKNT